VRFLQSFPDLDRIVDGSLRFLDRKHLSEHLAVNVFHHDELLPIVFGNIIDRADVGMIQRGGSTGFLEESRLFIRCGAEMMGEEFERNIAVQLRAMGLIDDAHATFAKFLKDIVV
jgi:hypothetical protein